MTNKFQSDVVGNYLLDDAIKWIRASLEPHEVFTEEQLAKWAVEHGFDKEVVEHE